MRKIITTGSDDRLIKLYNSNANFTEYSDTISKLSYFLACNTRIPSFEWTRMLDELTREEAPDTTILVKIWERIHGKTYDEKNFNQLTLLTPKSMIKRSMKRILDVEKIANKLNLQFSSNDLWIDIGSGDGSFAFLVNRKYGCNTIGIDVVKPNEYFTAKVKFIDAMSFKDYSDLGLSPKVISCFMTLHHIKEHDEVLKSMIRIIQKGGYLIIREHDAKNESRKVTLDLFDKLYEYSMYNPPDSNIEDYSKSNISFFMSIKDVIDICIDNGLDLIFKKSISHLNNVKDYNYVFYLVFVKRK